MSSDDFAIRINGLGKCYHIYNTPGDRLKQFVMPRLHGMAGVPSKQYFQEFWALKNVSFEIKKGETVGIIGRNGSGKSTLLQIICGTLTPTNGSVETRGRIAALLELGSGFNPEFTGRENVYMNAAILGLSSDEIDDCFDNIVDFADIGNFLEQPVKTYSSGMMLRLAFAVAINVDPDILIVDEALSVGDELFQRKCFSRIETIRDNGATVLFVSHSGGVIVELCDRAVLMDSGENLAVGLPKKIVGDYQKMLYAPVEKRDVLREQMRRTSEQSVDASSEASVVANENHVSIEQVQQDFFDPNLKPSSTIEYESHGVLIEGAEVQNMAGKVVNNLTRGKVYRYVYNVRFIESASSVRFGMLIKTTSGVELGGCASAKASRDSLLFIKAGSSYRVEFSFNCVLNAGVYFLNAGVIGGDDGIYLHRMIDISMFRVHSDEDSLATGIVDFSGYPDIEFQQGQSK